MRVLKRLYACLICALLVGATACAKPKHPESHVRVPALGNLTRQQAEEALSIRHLKWRFHGSKRVMSAAPENRSASLDAVPVTGQRPSAGTLVAPGSIVTITTACDRPPRHAGCA